MSLDQPQIKYIDNYLKYHKVDYWDIRIELLDHIVSKVETLMEDGNSFESALEEVHVGFGNSISRNWNSGKEIGIFADKRGFTYFLTSNSRNLRKEFFRKLVYEIFSNTLTTKGITLLIAIVILNYFLFFHLNEVKGMNIFVSVIFLILYRKIKKTFSFATQEIKSEKTLNLDVLVSALKQFTTISIFLIFSMLIIGALLNLTEIQIKIVGVIYFSVQILVLFYGNKLLEKKVKEYILIYKIYRKTI